MAIKKLTIELVPYAVAYVSGQDVEGFVTARVTSPVACRSVDVTCAGQAFVEWEITENKSTKLISDTESYVSLSVNVWRPSRSEEEELPEGNYTWPFCFRLPVDIPSSFEGERGYIRYQIKVSVYTTFLRQCYTDNDTQTIGFCVSTLVDLNTHELAQKPLEVRTVDTSCCLCCKGGPVSLQFKCTRSGGVIGENFKVTGEVTNEGRKEVLKTSVSLYQDVKYFIKGRKAIDQPALVSKISRGIIPPGESEVYAGEGLTIKAAAPSLAKCSLVKMSYYLRFSAWFGTCSTVQVKVPFFIGTIPFKIEGAATVNPAIHAPLTYPNSSGQSTYSGCATGSTHESESTNGGFRPPSNEGNASIYGPPPPSYAVEDHVPESSKASQEKPGSGSSFLFVDYHTSGQPMIGRPLPADNPYPIKDSPGYEGCYLSCHTARARWNDDVPPPCYISYNNVMLE